MAFTNFYLVAGGAGASNINAGSTTGAAQSAPATGGSWTNATNTFVATGGTPFGTTLVGDYVSVYADAATVTTYVAQVTTVVSNVSVILSATIKYGTAPTDGAANRSAVAGGAWTSEIVLAATGLGTFTIPQSTKINIKGNLTVAAARTISAVGTTLLILWFSAYNTTPGDLDTDTTNSLTKPIWTFNSTFSLTLNTNFAFWLGLSIVGSRSGFIVSIGSTSPISLTRCRIENTSSNAAAIALTIAGTGATCSYCFFKCPTTATTTGVLNIAGSNANFFGCIAEGGGLAGYNNGTSANCYYNCIAYKNTGSGFLATTGNMRIMSCSIYGATVDGIKWTSAPSLASTPWIIDCIFSGLNSSTATTNGINNASGANIATVYRSNNDYYNVTNREVGFGDSPEFFPQSDSSPIMTSDTDMTPVATSNAIGNGFAKVFEGGGSLGAQVNSGLAVGAVHPSATASSGSAVAIFGG